MKMTESTGSAIYVLYSGCFLKRARKLDEDTHAGCPAEKDITEDPVCRVGIVFIHFMHSFLCTPKVLDNSVKEFFFVETVVFAYIQVVAIYC